MKFYTLIFLITLKSALEIKNLRQNIIWLDNSDFKNGSYIITNPGIYRFKEDIEFNPPKVSYGYLKKNFAFVLGFFAAIVVQSNDVEIDLNGFKITQSLSFYIKQRFYAHIELGSSPFIKNFGPVDFVKNGEYFIAVKNVKIKNGNLGLSSHHGIHGNNSKNVSIENVQIENFEVAGIAINGGINININNVKVGPTSDKVHINGNFSAALQILDFVKALDMTGDFCDESKTAFLTINRLNVPAYIILKNLEDEIEKTIDNFLNNKLDKINKIFRNKEGIPDGSTVYGILLHSKKPANHGFENVCDVNEFSKNIIIKNTIIENLKNSVRETVFLKSELDPSLNNGKEGQSDARGSMLDILRITSKHGNYKPNVLSNAQLLVSKYKRCFIDKVDKFKQRHLHGLNPEKDTISVDVLEWAAGNVFKLNIKLLCNGDLMGNSMKGTVGLRLGGIKNATLKNVQIQNIQNLSPFGSTACGNYEAGVSLNNTITGFLGADLRGITIETSQNINFQDVFIRNLKSFRGKVIGVDVMFETSDIKGNFFAKNLNAPSWKDLPEYFNEVPQNMPFSSPLFITGNGKCNLDFVSANDKDFKTVKN